MRITLIHNPTSGDTPLGRDELVSILEGEGYQTAYYSTKDGKKRKKDWRRAIDDEPADLILAAGGDGTVRKVALALSGSSTPFAVLPLGTANNIAKTLGLHGKIQTIARRWKRARARPFDLGVVEGARRDVQFVESFGGGLFASLIRRGADEVEAAPKVVGRETDRAVFLLREIGRKSRPQPWTVTIDGKDASGSYLAVEILNVRFGGPNIALAPKADPRDGRLDVVLIGPAERDALDVYLKSRLEHGAAAPLELPVRRARAVTLQAPRGAAFHLDDEIWPARGPVPKRPIEVRIWAGATRLIR
jgi:diacylglycerol kinase family enzyme